MDVVSDQLFSDDMEDDVLLLDEAEHFLKGRLYHRFQEHFARQAEDALVVLKDADPETQQREIRSAQETIRYCERFPRWLEEIIVRGRTSLMLMNGVSEQESENDYE